MTNSKHWKSSAPCSLFSHSPGWKQHTLFMNWWHWSHVSQAAIWLEIMSFLVRFIGQFVLTALPFCFNTGPSSTHSGNKMPHGCTRSVKMAERQRERETVNTASISSCYYGCIATGPDVLFNRDEEIPRINPISSVLHSITACEHIKGCSTWSHAGSLASHVTISTSSSCLDSQTEVNLILDMLVEVDITSRSVTFTHPPPKIKHCDLFLMQCDCSREGFS